MAGGFRASRFRPTQLVAIEGGLSTHVRVGTSILSALINNEPIRPRAPKAGTKKLSHKKEKELAVAAARARALEFQSTYFDLNCDVS